MVFIFQNVVIIPAKTLLRQTKSGGFLTKAKLELPEHQQQGSSYDSKLLGFLNRYVQINCQPWGIICMSMYQYKYYMCNTLHTVLEEEILPIRA